MSRSKAASLLLYCISKIFNYAGFFSNRCILHTLFDQKLILAEPAERHKKN